MTFTFGSPGNNGTVAFASSSITTHANDTIDVAAGTLQATDTSLSTLLSQADSTVIEAGATIKSPGLALDIKSLSGSGALKDSGGAATLTLHQGTFGGVISGAFGVNVASDVYFTGANTYTGGTLIAAAP